MSDETNQAVDQGSAAQEQQAQDAVDKKDLKLSEEAAKWRLKVRDLEAQLKEVQPKAQQYDQLQEAQKTQEQKLTERLAALEADLAQKQADAERAQKQTQLVRLATKAGVDPDIVELLDLSKLDLADEKKVLDVLGRFARTAAGAQVKPGGESGGTTDAELRKQYFSGQSRTTIFGG